MTHNIIIRHRVFPCIPGKGRRPRRPAFPMASPLASPCARRAGDVAPYHNNMVGIMWHLVFPWTLVGADVPGGPRPRWRLRWRPCVRGAPWTSRPTIVTWLASCGTLCSRVPGRGRRPRRPASPMASPLASLCARRAVDVAPYHNNMVGIMWHLVFQCIPGRGRRPRRPASRWRLRWRPHVRGAPWTSRPTIITCSPSYGTLCSRVSLVGADVPGGPRPDGVSDGVPVCAARRGRRALP